MKKGADSTKQVIRGLYLLSLTKIARATQSIYIHRVFIQIIWKLMIQEIGSMTNYALHAIEMNIFLNQRAQAKWEQHAIAIESKLSFLLSFFSLSQKSSSPLFFIPLKKTKTTLKNNLTFQQTKVKSFLLINIFYVKKII